MKTNNAIDLSYLERTFDGNKDTISIVLQSFINNTPQLTKELIDCITNASWENAKMLAHKIKSSFITIGAKKTGDLLEKIEMESSDENKDVIQRLIKKLIEMSEQVFSEVNSTIYSYGQ